jgi:predicted membrane-bound spermidine synthase
VVIAGKRMAGGRGKVLLYFGSIGLSYLFIEILLMQVYARYVNNPLYSNSVVIAAMLLFSGVGSFFSDRLRNTNGFRRRVLLPLVSALTVYVSAVLLGYDHLAETLINHNLPLIPLMVALLAPAGVIMGFFFPLGLAAVKRRGPYSLPWAWSVNGFFSVIASTGAVLVTSNTGIPAAGLIPVAGYWVALLSFPSD